MKFNKQVDMGSYPYMDNTYFQVLLKDDFDNVYVTFVAIEGDNRADTWQEEGNLYIRIPLPYQEACSFRALELMKEKLIDALLELDDMDLLIYVTGAIYLDDAEK